MKYMLLICDDEVDPPTMEQLATDPVHTAWLADLDRRGGVLGMARLRPSIDATTVRVRAGETLVADGPFAETKDLVGGFLLIDCPDLDAAVQVAAGHPYAERGCIEVRPVWE